MTIDPSRVAANDNLGCVDPEALARVRVMMHPPHRIHLTELLRPRQPLANENRDWNTMTIPERIDDMQALIRNCANNLAEPELCDWVKAGYREARMTALQAIQELQEELAEQRHVD